MYNVYHSTYIIRTSSKLDGVLFYFFFRTLNNNGAVNIRIG